MNIKKVAIAGVQQVVLLPNEHLKDKGGHADNIRTNAMRHCERVVGKRYAGKMWRNRGFCRRDPYTDRVSTIIVNS